MTDFQTLLLMYLVSLLIELGMFILLFLLGRRMLCWVAISTFNIKEIGKGNVAAALVFASAILSIFMGCWPPFNNFVFSMVSNISGMPNHTILITLLFNSIISLVFMVALVAFSVRVCSFICGGLNVDREVEKGNIAVAIILSLTILMVAGLFSQFLFGALTNLETLLFNAINGGR